MPDVTPPEICRTSLAGAVLQLKALGLPGLDVLSFGFLDPPEQVRVGICWQLEFKSKASITESS
jgi:HrpA-like RNA helicase